ncbi:hypothetical protein F4805DRAFT_444662, partial [Annulohypoxylon moriforme]
MNIHHHVSSGNIRLYRNQVEKYLETSAYDGLGQYLAQQELDGNFALELWRSQSVYEGPLRLVPDLLRPGDVDHELGNWNSNYQNSDDGATGCRTPDRNY